MNYRIPRKTLIAAFLASLVFPLLIFLLFSPLIGKAIEFEGKEKALRVADHLTKHLDLRMSELSPEHWKKEINDDVKDINHNFGLYETCIISADGYIVYSSNDEKLGEPVPGELIDNLLAKGKRYFAVRHEGEVSLEGFLVHGSVIEAYVPIFDKDRAIGGVAVFYDFSQLYGQIDRLKIYFAILLFVISFAAMLMIYFYHVKAEHGKQLGKKAEEALEQEQIKAETVFSSLGDNIIIQDRDYKIIYQNSINRDLWGDHRGEFCYAVYEGLDHICPDCPVELTYRDGEIHKMEKEVTKDKGSMYLELTASPLRNPDGEIVAGIKVVRDISEKRRIEEQLRHAQKMQAIGTLTSGISHEFNNALTSINGFSEMLMEMVRKDTDEYRYIESIYRSGKRAEEVTKGLLAYSRKQISNRSVISLNEIVMEIGRVFSVVIGNDITVRLDPCPEKLTVLADRAQLEQVLINIITNARDAMNGGGELLIRTEAVTADEPFVQRHGFGSQGASYAAISVRDTGLGMGKETLEHIFDPFFTTKDVGHGTGLGLSIVYGIVEQHGGFMDVTSTPGVGTEFTLFLPRLMSKKGDTSDMTQTEKTALNREQQ